MRRKIPSTDALIAFEAAARHLSFTRSAEELSLTQSAVGRQVAALEEYLGTPMFNRFKRRISLTEAGELYAKRVRENLERIERDTLATMAHRSAGGILELAVIPTFATRWLIPRLPEFYAKHENVVINLTTRAAPFLFKDTPFDAAIHFGDPVWPGSVTRYLFGEEITAVCSPRLLEGKENLSAREAAEFTLLHQSARPDAWRQWLAQAGVHDVDSMKGQRYELFSMLVEAAKAGLGVALIPRFLIAHELRSGELVRPCDLSLPNDKGYYLVYPEHKQNSSLISTFERWLISAAEDYVRDDVAMNNQGLRTNPHQQGRFD
ncbi:LysR family transcriptional regulator [Caballeronia sp. LZ008]|uniref:LysR family transcriptional regulator n=1 Tax=unclassified Caballeronia TaxID=2646786 RepID=UPI0020298D74|nr:LysR family transcriptional regulator [Caballeronia sp. LZ008]MDR5796468.1 LysR family transcriptional regulator [Caballeronia sp. LZ008]